MNSRPHAFVPGISGTAWSTAIAEPRAEVAPGRPVAHSPAGPLETGGRTVRARFGDYRGRSCRYDAQGVTALGRPRAALARADGSLEDLPSALDLTELDGQNLRARPWTVHRQALTALLRKARGPGKTLGTLSPPPMALGNTRANGVRSSLVYCVACHQAGHGILAAVSASGVFSAGQPDEKSAQTSKANGRGAAYRSSRQSWGHPLRTADRLS